MQQIDAVQCSRHAINTLADRCYVRTIVECFEFGHSTCLVWCRTTLPLTPTVLTTPCGETAATTWVKRKFQTRLVQQNFQIGWEGIFGAMFESCQYSWALIWCPWVTIQGGTITSWLPTRLYRILQANTMYHRKLLGSLFPSGGSCTQQVIKPPIKLYYMRFVA